MKYRVLHFLLVVCLLLCSIVPSAFAVDGGTITRHDIEGAKYFRISELEGLSDITVTELNDTICLAEDGLEVCLSANSRYVFRNSCVVAVLNTEPVFLNGEWYISVDFYDDFLCKDDAEKPSLFNGSMYFASEVLAAIYGTGNDVFSQKLLNEVSLPTSLGISELHIDMDRIFITTPLSEYSSELISEMKHLGIENPEQLAYSEYAVISGAQTLESAGMSDLLDKSPELSAYDPTIMTVAEYSEWQRKEADAQFEESLSAEAKQFAEEKEISISDLKYLNRYFYGSYIEKDDEELRGALMKHYEVDVSYLRSLANPFIDIQENDWFFDDVISVRFGGLMNGTSDNLFSPYATTTRGMVVTVLYRLEDEPAVNYSMSFDDVDNNTWYTEAVRWAASKKIVEGYGDGNFGVNDAITREQLVTILYRYAQYKGYDVSVGENTNILSYDDSFSISEYAYPALQWACGAGIISGDDGSLLPQNNATRSQVAVILRRFNDLDTNQGQNINQDRGEFATLYVYGALSGEGIAEDGRCEYTLSSEDSNVIIALFYSKEKETLETPLDCISTIEFRLGEDYLGTSLNDINVLSGRIDGKLVAVYLDEDESSILKQLVYTYAPDIAH